MTLTQQFLVISILPLSFIGMVLYAWRARVPRRRVIIRWTVTLIAAAIWSSNILRFYGGVTFTAPLVFTWGIIGAHVFGLTALGVLTTTFTHLSIPRDFGRLAIGLSVLLWFISLGLDPAIWRYEIPLLEVAGQTVRHFDIWAAAWITSWLLPLIAAWILTQRARGKSSVSLYQNQVSYWLLVLALFFIGSVFTSIRQPGQVFWQEIGMLFIILSAFTGTVSIANSQLTELQLAVRQVLSRLSGTLILFGLTWVALRTIVQGVTNLPTDTDPNLILTLATALFAVLFTLAFRWITILTHRLFVPSTTRREKVMASYTNTVGALPEPELLGEHFLRIIQSNLDVGSAWIFTAEDGVGGKLILRPLDGLDSQPTDVADFDGNTQFTRHLRTMATPLTQYDIDILGDFDDMPADEKALLTSWDRVLYLPLLAGDHLVGVLALGKKHLGQSYERKDFDLLESLAAQISPLLAQARNLASLRRINDFVFQQNQALTRESHHLTELINLYTQFLAHISPELRQPFTSIRSRLLQLLDESAENFDSNELVSDLEEQISHLQSTIDRLITEAAQIRAREQLSFQPVRLDEIIHQVIRNLRGMAEARRVEIEFEPDTTLPMVVGDDRQLQEAVRHLVHNAIKFNKIGGKVQITQGTVEGHLRLQVIDNGVGIPEERLERIWTGIANGDDKSSRRGGLGLALTRFIVAAHGGYVEATSTHGVGSVFSIYLPEMVPD